MQTIELDCPPGPTRPDNLIRSVVQGLDITPLDWEVIPFFGEAVYEFDIPRAEWETKYQPTIKERVTALYHAGVIRYGSW